MVGFVSDSAIDKEEEEELNHQRSSKLKNSNNSPFVSVGVDPSVVVDINGFVFSSSFDESFVDFDTIKDWIKDIPDPVGVCSDKPGFSGIEEFLEMADDDSCVKTESRDQIVDGSGTVVKAEGGESVEMGNLSFAIKEEREDFSAAFVDRTEPVVSGSESVANASMPVLDGDGSGCVVKVERSDPIVSGPNPVVDESSRVVKLEGENCEKVDNLSCRIEEDMGKVSLVGAAENMVVGDGNDIKSGEEVNEGGESSSSAESESSASSSSEEDIDDDDDDDNDEIEKGEEKKAYNRKVEVKEDADDVGQMEEGEIRDDNDDDDDENVKGMVGWSDDDVLDGDDEDEEGVKKGPIKSKNELKFLPPVPAVDVTLQPCHQTLPVGVVLSILGTQVIVEGVENHEALNEGSILWITERRVPLGLVDEIFGPVKNPYYVVRYNSENEVPAQIHEGTRISFVPEFANHVFNDKNVYKKGYDASGENDEEVLDEVEFSDDEKEAEYRRMMKTTKRSTNDQKHGSKKNNKKKVNNRNDNWKMDHQPLDILPQTSLGSLAPDKNRHNVSPSAPPLDHSKPRLVSPFPQPAQSAGPIPTPNGFWINGMPCQPQPSSMFSNGMPTQSMPWPQQNHLQFPYQIPLPNGMPFQQPYDLNQRFLPNVVLPGGQPNFIAAPAYAPWPGLMGQNGFNPATYGMGLQGQHARPSQNAGGQGVPFQNTGGQGVPFQNTGGQGVPFLNIGGQGVPFQNTGGQGVPSQSTGEQGSQNTGGQGVPAAGFCMVKNNNMPRVIPGHTENPQHFNPGASSGRGRKPYRRGGGRFSRGRNQH